MVLLLATVYAVPASNPEITANYGTLKPSKIQFLGEGVAIYGWNQAQTTDDVMPLLMGMKKISIAIGTFPASIKEYIPVPQTPGMLHSNRIVREYIDVKRVGLLKLGETKYGLTEVQAGTNHFEGNVYSSPSKNAELIGKFILDKRELTTSSADTETWIGTLKIKENGEDKELGLFMTMKKMFTVKQLAQKVENYCLLTDTGSEQCLWIQNQGTTITSYCEKNPNDVKCQELQIKYCASKASLDSRCYKLLEEYCNNATDSEKPEFCTNDEINGEISTGINTENAKQEANKLKVKTETQNNGEAWWINTETQTQEENQQGLNSQNQNQGLGQN